MWTKRKTTAYGQYTAWFLFHEKRSFYWSANCIVHSRLRRRHRGIRCILYLHDILHNIHVDYIIRNLNVWGGGGRCFAVSPTLFNSCTNFLENVCTHRVHVYSTGGAFTSVNRLLFRRGVRRKSDRKTVLQHSDSYHTTV